MAQNTNKVIFITYCPRNLQERFATKKLESTFKYFHPDLPFFIYEDENIDRIYKEYNVNLSNALPCLMLDAKRKFGAEYVCHIDSDSLVLGRLDQILEFDYEIASVLNNHDMTGRDERQNRPKELWSLDNNKYVSCGCISTSSEDFLLRWIELNKDITIKYGGVKSFWQCDQNMMNIIFHYGGFNSKILDPLDGKYFYGPSANMYSENNHNPEHVIKEWGGRSQWQSWFDIEYKDGEFWLYNKICKLLHNCAGGNKDTVYKCHFSLFNDKTRKILQEITRYNE